MDHRVLAILAVVCLALEGAGCAWMKKKPRGEEIVMPQQTGSLLQRRVRVDSGEEVTKPEKKKVAKRKSPKPTPTREATSKPEEPATPEEEATPAAPERFR